MQVVPREELDIEAMPLKIFLSLSLFPYISPFAYNRIVTGIKRPYYFKTAAYWDFSQQANETGPSTSK